MYEQDVALLIKDQGWRIAKGPYFNTNLAKKGIYVWSIKSTLSFDELKKRGIKVSKTGKQGGSQRTVRFLGEVMDGRVVSIQHITTTQRKKLSSTSRRRRKKTES